MKINVIPKINRFYFTDNHCFVLLSCTKKESIKKFTKSLKARSAKMGIVGENFDLAPSRIEVLMKGNEMTSEQRLEQMKSSYKNER